MQHAIEDQNRARPARLPQSIVNRFRKLDRVTARLEFEPYLLGEIGLIFDDEAPGPRHAPPPADWSAPSSSRKTKCSLLCSLQGPPPRFTVYPFAPKDWRQDGRIRHRPFNRVIHSGWRAINVNCSYGCNHMGADGFEQHFRL